MHVRQADEGDLEGITHLYANLRPEDPTLDRIHAAALLGNVIRSEVTSLFVAEVDGQLASTCMLALIPNFASGGRPIGVIEHVITLPEHRGKGLAMKTIDTALGFAWAKRCCKVFLLSGATRTEAHRLYESLGFNGDVERGFVIKAPIA